MEKEKVYKNLGYVEKEVSKILLRKSSLKEGKAEALSQENKQRILNKFDEDEDKKFVNDNYDIIVDYIYDLYDKDVDILNKRKKENNQEDVLNDEELYEGEIDDLSDEIDTIGFGFFGDDIETLLGIINKNRDRSINNKIIKILSGINNVLVVGIFLLLTFIQNRFSDEFGMTYGVAFIAFIYGGITSAFIYFFIRRLNGKYSYFKAFLAAFLGSLIEYLILRFLS